MTNEKHGFAAGALSPVAMGIYLEYDSIGTVIMVLWLAYVLLIAVDGYTRSVD